MPARKHVMLHEINLAQNIHVITCLRYSFVLTCNCCNIALKSIHDLYKAEILWVAMSSKTKKAKNISFLKKD